jgi:hypothetical protein
MIRILAPAILLATSAMPALAAPPPAQPPAQDQAANSDDEVVCRVLKVTGSRLGAQRTCMTRAQWRAQRADHREETDKAQRQRWYTNPDAQ